MIKPDTMICHCNNLEAQEIVAYIKEHHISDHHDLVVDEKDFECGNKCEYCLEKGFHEDGLSLKLLVEMVQKGEF